MGGDSPKIVGAESATSSLGPRGSLAPGATNYTPPGGAIYVSPSGNDTTGTGAIGTPYATLGKAVSVAAANSTIVLRAGTYHEGSTPGSQGLGIQIAVANLHIQSYPDEEVWLDGSSSLGSWSQHAAGVWKHSWPHTFDRSGTYSWGGSPSGVLVDPAYPLASYPEQFWADDVPLRQVATLAQVTVGTFYVDLAADLVYIGTDPTGKAMRGADRCAAITCLSSGTGFWLRGIGLRKYANQCPDFGVLKLNRADAFLENVWIEDVSTTGIYWYNGTTSSHNVHLNRVTVLRAGQMGAGGTQADDVLIENCRFDDCNTQRFSGGQAAGGVKITKSRRITIRNSTANRTLSAPGWWFDQSVYDVTITGWDAIGSGTTGLVFENSTKLLAVDGIAADGLTGVHILGSDGAVLWNVTTCNNREDVVLQQDERTPANTPVNLDSRYGADAYTDWFINSFAMRNCIISKASTGAPLWRVKSINLAPPRDWSTFGIVSDTNMVNRHTGSNSVVSLCTTGSELYLGWASYKSTTSLDGASIFIDGTQALDPVTFMPTVSAAALINNQGTPLPTDVASAAYRPAASTRIGAWPRT